MGAWDLTGSGVFALGDPSAHGLLVSHFCCDAGLATVHRLIVRRGTQVRDLLGSGQDFTVLRREDMLEQATLTGMLTAVLQPPDLQIAWFNSPVQRVHFRASWPRQMAVRWQSRDFKPELQESAAGDSQSIAFTLENPAPLLQPTGAPMRYAAILRLKPVADQYMDKWRLDRSGVHPPDNRKVKSALGFH